MEAKVRGADGSDAEAIATLTRELGYEAEPRAIAALLERWADEARQQVFVAETKRVVGWIHVIEMERLTGGETAEIVGLVVANEDRRGGTGTALVRATMDWARGRQRTRLRVRCNVRREGAHAFYEWLGFGPSKQQAVYDLELPV